MNRDLTKQEIDYTPVINLEEGEYLQDMEATKNPEDQNKINELILYTNKFKYIVNHENKPIKEDL